MDISKGESLDNVMELLAKSNVNNVSENIAKVAKMTEKWPIIPDVDNFSKGNTNKNAKSLKKNSPVAGNSTTSIGKHCSQKKKTNKIVKWSKKDPPAVLGNSASIGKHCSQKLKPKTNVRKKRDKTRVCLKEGCSNTLRTKHQKRCSNHTSQCKAQDCPKFCQCGCDEYCVTHWQERVLSKSRGRKS